MIEKFTDISNVVTACGVLLAAWSLWMARSLSQSSFEDGLAKEYRELVRDIPVDVLLGREVEPEKAIKVRELVFNYLDLTNEQAYLRCKGRIRKSTWYEWAEGARFNLSLPMFHAVWEEVKQEAPDMFTELRRLEAENFEVDPRCWKIRLICVK